MVDKNLEKTLLEEWEKIRKEHFYPQLPPPKLVDNIPNGSINMEKLKIKVSEPFIKDFSEKKIDGRGALNEVLTHELTHFMKYPGSVLNMLRLQKIAMGVADKEKANQLREAFVEAQTNIYMVNVKNHPFTVPMRRLYVPEDSLGKLMYGLYQEKWRQDIGIELTSEEKDLIQKLSQINYVDKNHEKVNFKSFVETLKDYEIKQQQSEDSLFEKLGKAMSGLATKIIGRGDQSDNGGETDYVEATTGIEMFSDNEIRKGIALFAQECESGKEFEEIVTAVLFKPKQEEKKGNGKELELQGGLKAGTERIKSKLVPPFYTALAQQYTVPVKKKPLEGNGGLYPYSYATFSIGDSFSDLDSFSSLGILPGITKRWIRREGETMGNYENTPNSVLVVDNSGSMPDPEKGISVPVLAATVISNAYLDNNAKVSVYNFGGHDFLLPFSNEKEGVHAAIRQYSGGGTQFTSQIFYSLLEGSDTEFDVSVISDMEIHNLESFIQTFLRIQKTHRVHLIHTRGDGSWLKQRFASYQNVAVIPLYRSEDIPNLVMGELPKSIF